jgi:hypothetical protein
MAPSALRRARPASGSGGSRKVVGMEMGTLLRRKFERMNVCIPVVVDSGQKGINKSLMLDSKDISPVGVRLGAGGSPMPIGTNVIVRMILPSRHRCQHQGIVWRHTLAGMVVKFDKDSPEIMAEFAYNDYLSGFRAPVRPTPLPPRPVALLPHLGEVVSLPVVDALGRTRPAHGKGRFYVEVPAKIALPDEGGAVAAFLTHKLGTGGCMLRGGQGVAPGDIVKIVLNLDGVWVAVVSRILYAHGREGMVLSGVRFLDIEPAEEEILEEFIARRLKDINSEILKASVSRGRPLSGRRSS